MMGYDRGVISVGSGGNMDYRYPVLPQSWVHQKTRGLVRLIASADGEEDWEGKFVYVNVIC